MPQVRAAWIGNMIDVLSAIVTLGVVIYLWKRRKQQCQLKDCPKRDE